jgi:hypothetical protein
MVASSIYIVDQGRNAEVLEACSLKKRSGAGGEHGSLWLIDRGGHICTLIDNFYRYVYSWEERYMYQEISRRWYKKRNCLYSQWVI